MEQIYINGRFLSQKITGVQRYAYEITKALIQLNPTITILTPVNAQIPEEVQSNCFQLGTRSGNAWEQIDLPRFINKSSRILLNLCNTAPLFSKRSIITIHDCSVYKNPEWFSFGFRTWYKFLLPKIARKAIHIYTVSEFSKSEIEHHLRVSSSQITVIYPGIQESFIPKVIAHKKENIILHIGTISDRKNISCLIQGFKNAELKEYQLILCGNIDPNLRNNLSIEANENIHIISDCDDISLMEWLYKAKFIINGSHYEGFGIPILEGIVNGAYPIVSDIPVFREWIQENACYFDPNSSDSLKEMLILSAQNNPKLSEDIRQNFLEEHNYQKNTQSLWKNLKTHLKK